ncbi:TIGR03435 family protein [Terriglobus roseus]|uniref:Soil-associated protein, TIGR03435 family n=1 Tax=Terriglobus roseus TaxID=392734 RepID=A0A1H4LZP0_9BACT|nr:TIGR03435 family protein [Terriglobus roseus]SEB76320.1 soil-associated protein, TIGR03435 family [Terriglobus roseus]
MLFLLRNVLFAGALAIAQARSAGVAPLTSGKSPLAWASVAIHESDPTKDATSWNSQANGVDIRGLGLKQLISQGYDFSVTPFRDDEISGLPNWARSTRYDIVARVDTEDIPAFKKITDLSMQDTIAAFSARQATGQMLMMQSLLTDRFHLKVHWEQKERAVYTLSVAKGGLRLQPAADTLHGSMMFSRGHLSGKGVPVSFLASLLEIPSDRTVSDMTGVTGSYDFDLRFDPADGAAETPSNDPNLFTALQEQLGLKLQSSRASVPVLVVDHVERPTPN